MTWWSACGPTGTWNEAIVAQGVAGIGSTVIFALPLRNELTSMLIIPVKEGEPIDKALKKFKKKFERTGTLRALRRRQSFSKPSVKLRAQKLRAIYKLKTYGGEQ